MSAVMFPTLTADQVEVKVKQVTQKGALLLLYKTARTDYEMLDAVCGPEFWHVSYSEVKDALYCTISVWSDKLSRWVSKSNCGTESREDVEGNEKKGEASDAMKRAGFVWGIGRELYSAPFIFVSVPTHQSGKGWAMDDRFATFSVKEIEYDDKRRINRLVIVDKAGDVVFTYPRGAARSNVNPYGPINPNNGEPMDEGPKMNDGGRAAQRPQAGAIWRRTAFQVNEVRRLCNDTQYAVMEQKYGKNLDKMTFEQANKAIDALKKRAGENTK